ncbi:heterokaryon incompatibility protein-domain-containing protein [Bisporella sp. PMI_857]|nr:heterokaryon incompatibility protein-domain-containing protein [Bisporella sp. PMI_857]
MSRDLPGSPGHQRDGPSGSGDIAEFAYSPLKEQQIRLIELLPGARGSPINCKIVHSGLDSASEQYECLSYVWGPPLIPQSISMNGTTIDVRQNLRAALEAIRDEVKPRTIWIDALCINQKDIHERNKQVANMGKIFRHATKVLVWLGEAADDSDLLFDHISAEEDGWGYEWVGPLDSRSAEAMLAFYCRSYWKRVWVIQEILIATSLDLFCGTKCMPMDMYRYGFTSFLWKMKGLAKSGNNPPWFTKALENNLQNSPGCNILRQQYGGKTEDFSLLRLLEMCADCKSECQLVHDRIYGLIGVLKASQQGLVVPDYSKPLCQVYVDVLILLLTPDTASDSHFVSTWGYIGKDLIASSRTTQHLLEHPLWNEKVGAFHPVASICSASQLNNMRKLRLDVWIEGVAAISEVGDALTPEALLASDSPGLNQADAIQMDRFRAAVKDLDISDFHCTYEIGTRYMKKLTDPPTTPFSPIQDGNTGKDIILHQSTGENRPFITNNGLLGLASTTVQKGDLLYGFNSLEDLFLGTRNLYLIIRPGTDHSVYSFTLIGRGIMLPVPEEKYCNFTTKRRKGKYAKFNFKDDLLAEGVDVDYDMFEQINCYMDATTLFLLTR